MRAPRRDTKHCIHQAEIKSSQQDKPEFIEKKDFPSKSATAAAAAEQIALRNNSKSADYCCYLNLNCASSKHLKQPKVDFAALNLNSSSSNKERNLFILESDSQPKSRRQIEPLRADELLWSARRLAASGRHEVPNDQVSSTKESRSLNCERQECDSSEHQSDLGDNVCVVESQLSSHQLLVDASRPKAIQGDDSDFAPDHEDKDLKRQDRRLIERRRTGRSRLRSGAKSQSLLLRNSQSALLLLLASLFSLLVVQSLLSSFSSSRLPHRANRVRLVGAALVANANNDNFNRPTTLTSINQIKTHQHQQAGVPYKTVHVTQVCEWKSNLFVPKSNDIHFAQPFISPQLEQSHNNLNNPTFNNNQQNHLNSNNQANPNDWQPESAIRNSIEGQQQQQQNAVLSNGFPLESSIVYDRPSLLRDQQHPSRQHQHYSNFNFNVDTNGSGSGNDMNGRANRQATSQLVSNNNNLNSNSNVNANSRAQHTTVERNEQKALVLGFPIEFGQQFAGFEPACSIRLIVPENMRILAQITSRHLKFEQEPAKSKPTAAPPTTANSHSNTNLQQPPFFGLPPSPAFLWPQPPPTQNSNFNFQTNQPQPPPPPHQDATIWLNVSSDLYTEFHQETVETPNNELAFRFILERNTHKKFPDLRFQVVLTAFQTLSENSDLNHGGQLQPAANQGEQFICDQQRLISANLACDGYKNCQDGQDEEAQACALVRHSNPTPNPNQPLQPSSMNQENNNSNNGASNQSTSGDNSNSSFFWPGWFSSSPNSSSSSKQKQQEQHATLDATNNREWASITGFILGFLLVLVLLLACVLPICYFLFLLLCTNRDRLRNFFSHDTNDNLSQQQPTTRSQTRPTTTAFKNIADFLRRSKVASSSHKRENSRQRQQNRISIARLEQERLNEMRRQNANNERRLSALIESSNSSQVIAQQQQGKIANNANLPPASRIQHLQSILKRPASVQPVSGSSSSGVAASAMQQQQQQSQRPLERPPNIPERPIRRGALASSLRSRGSSGSRQASMVFPRQPQQQAGLFGRKEQPAARPGSQQQQFAQFKPTPAQRLTRPTRPVPPPLMSPQFNPRSGSQQEQRVTTYHFSSASTSFSQAYLEKLPTTSGGQQRTISSGFGAERRGSSSDDQQQQNKQPGREKKSATNLTSLI